MLKRLTMKVYNKRTNIDGREPSVNEMEYGEIAVNYNATNPRLIIKDSNNGIENFLPESNINGRMDNVNNTLSNLNEKINENKGGIETVQSWINKPITDDEITKLMYPEITFSVSNAFDRYKTYQATKGMTWEQWINSNKYDIISPSGDKFNIQNDRISVIEYQGASDANVLHLNDRTTLVLKTDKIIENYNYYYHGEVV